MLRHKGRGAGRVDMWTQFLSPKNGQTYLATAEFVQDTGNVETVVLLVSQGWLWIIPQEPTRGRSLGLPPSLLVRVRPLWAHSQMGKLRCRLVQ